MKRRRRAQVESLDPEGGLVGSLRDGCGVEGYLGGALSPPDGCEEPGERADHRDKRKPAELEPRIGQRQREEGSGQQDLAQEQPAATTAKPFQPRQPDSIDQRRPEKFEGVGKPDPGQDADRGKVDFPFAEPCVERADQSHVQRTIIGPLSPKPDV